MPFTIVEFFSVFAQYNEAIWPLQLVVYLAGAVAVGVVFWKSPPAAAIITLILAAMWAVNGIGYHWLFFADINPAARVFAALFVIQALGLVLSTLVFPDLRFAASGDARSAAGLVAIAFAAIVYPIWGWLAGHAYPSVPMFGVAPCPTTIFTIGILLLGTWQVTRWLLIIPVLWSAIGGSAAIFLGVPQDFGLIATLLISLAFGVGHWRHMPFAFHRG